MTISQPIVAPLFNPFLYARDLDDQLCDRQEVVSLIGTACVNKPAQLTRAKIRLYRNCVAIGRACIIKWQLPLKEERASKNAPQGQELFVRYPFFSNAAHGSKLIATEYHLPVFKENEIEVGAGTQACAATTRDEDVSGRDKRRRNASIVLDGCAATDQAEWDQTAE